MADPWSPTCPPPRGLVRPVRMDPAGVDGPTRGEARGRAWRRVGQGWYLPSSASGQVEQRILEASVRLSSGGAVTGWAACRLYGGGFFDGLGRDGRTPLPVPLVIGPGRRVRSAPGIAVSYERVDAAEIELRHGIPCAVADRAVFDAMRSADGVREAVVAFDMAAAAGLTSIRRLSAYAARRGGWRGVARARSALALASEHSRSPAETRMRLVWLLDAELPVPLVNWPVLDLSGHLLAIADLLDPAAGLVCEYDGADHRSAARHTSDVRREDRLRRAGLEYVTVTGGDMTDRRLVADRILATRSRALWLPPDQRSWRPGDGRRRRF